MYSKKIRSKIEKSTIEVIRITAYGSSYFSWTLFIKPLPCHEKWHHTTDDKMIANGMFDLKLREYIQ